VHPLVVRPTAWANHARELVAHPVRAARRCSFTLTQRAGRQSLSAARGTYPGARSAVAYPSASCRRGGVGSLLIIGTAKLHRWHPLAVVEALDIPDAAIGAIGAAVIAFTGVALGWGFTAWQNRAERRAHEAATVRANRLDVYSRFLASFAALDRLTREIQTEDGDKLRLGVVSNEDYQYFMQCGEQVLLVASDETARRARNLVDAVDDAARNRVQAFIAKRKAAKVEAAGNPADAEQLRADASELTRTADKVIKDEHRWYRDTFDAMRADLNGETPTDSSKA
jgi:hypothetical protein